MDTTENFIVLYIAIKKKCTVEEAFLRWEGQLYNTTRKRLTIEDSKDMYKMQKQGLTLYEIADIYNIAFRTVKSRIDYIKRLEKKNKKDS